MKQICATCKHNKRDWTNPKNPDFYCGNEIEDNYGYPTYYDDKCDDWEGKNELSQKSTH